MRTNMVAEIAIVAADFGGATRELLDAAAYGVDLAVDSMDSRRIGFAVRDMLIVMRETGLIDKITPPEDDKFEKFLAEIAAE